MALENFHSALSLMEKEKMGKHHLFSLNLILSSVSSPLSPVFKINEKNFEEYLSFLKISFPAFSSLIERVEKKLSDHKIDEKR